MLIYWHLIAQRRGTMSSDPSNKNRRKLLTSVASVMGGIGIAGTAYPLVHSMSPSAQALADAANVKVDISDLLPGQIKVVTWRRLPVWILHRTSEMIADLESFDDQLRDPFSEITSQQPEYAKNRNRSIKPEYLVVIGVCTHLGCSPEYTPDKIKEVEDWWKGGFFCHCHLSAYDYAGRVFKGKPAPMNLPVPPYKFLSDTLIEIGDQEEHA